MMPYEETVERRRFHSFCKVVLRHEMLDCFREFSYQNKPPCLSLISTTINETSQPIIS